MENKNVWYAIQQTTEDGWDVGSYDFDEAVKMANDRGYDIIAKIENGDFCSAEYHRGDDF